MENGTYFCKGLSEILSIKKTKERLEKVALLFKEKEGIKLNFCRIYGKRWAYYAGDPDLVIPEKKLPINEHFGLIIENNTLDDKTWEALLKCFRLIVSSEIE